MHLSQNIDTIIAIFYLVLCLVIGFYKSKEIKNLKQFAIGKGNAKAPLLVAVIFATLIGAGSTIGATSKIYILGAFFVLVQLIQPIYFLISARIFANNIEKFKGCLTVSQVMFRLYGMPGRWLTTLAVFPIGAGVISIQATAIGYVFHYFLHVDVTFGILLSYGILTLYSASGGIRSVVFTEIFQFTIFFVVIPLSCVVFLPKLGSIENVVDSLPTTYIELEFTKSNIILLISFVIFALIPEVSSPSMQRYLMAANSIELKKSLKGIALITLPFTLSFCFIAYAIKVTAPDILPSDTLLYFTDQLPVGLRGVMIAGLLAITMSTAESWLNSMAVIAVNDIIKPLSPKIDEAKQLAMARFFTIAISIVSVIIAISRKDPLELIYILESFWQPLILIPISAGFLGFKTNSKTFIANTILAIIFCTIGRLIAGKFGLTSMISGILGSAIGFFGAHYFQVYSGTLDRPLPKLSVRLPKLRNPLANLPKKIKAFRERVWAEKPRIAAFGGFTYYCYFFFAITLNESHTNQILLTLMIIGFLIGCPLLMRDVFFSEKLQKRHLPFYWYFLVTYCLPFVGSYCLLASNGSQMWLINGLLLTSAVFYFMNAITSIFIVTIGALAGYIVFCTSNSYLDITPGTAPLLAPYLYLLMLAVTVLFIRHREKSNLERIETMQALGGTIAHEVRNPMSSMSMVVDATNQILNEAISSAVKKGKNYHITINEHEFYMLSSLRENMVKLSSKGNEVVRSILKLFRTTAEETGKETFNIDDMALKALEAYIPYNPLVRNIKVEISKNFKVTCNPTDFEHMIFNLLKNAYKYNGKDVLIRVAIKNNSLYFTDYGNGISPDVLPNIFDRFYTKGTGGTGLGLAFCKMIMESMGGSITCKSKPGQYTKFRLQFPKSCTSQV